MEDAPQGPPSHENAVGVQDRKSKASADISQEESAKQERDQEEANTAAPKSGAKRAFADNQKKEECADDETGEREDEITKPAPKPNPHRSIGDALRAWKKLLNVIDEDSASQSKSEQRESHHEPEQNELHRYLRQDEEKTKNATQALVCCYSVKSYM